METSEEDKPIEGKCEICSRVFPLHLLHPLVGHDLETNSSCPVCGLTYIRQVHCNPEFMFRNKDNLKNYLEALEIVKNDAEFPSH